MPSHKIHLVIANEVNKKLKLDNDSVMLGSVMPDLSIMKDHEISHYQVQGNYEDELANPDKFINEYKKELDNPIMIGYLIHILTDRFYNDYFFQNHCLFDEKNKPIKVKLRNKKIKYPIKKYKQSDFGKYDNYLLKKHLVPKFNDIKCVSNVKDLSVSKFDKEALISYITNANAEVDNPRLYNIKSSLFYKVFNKKELDKMLNECCNYIIDYINVLIDRN